MTWEEFEKFGLADKGLTPEDFEPAEYSTEEIAMTAYVNSELALALIELMEV